MVASPQFLISFKENPYFTFYLKSRGKYYKPLKKKNWVGLDKNGNELPDLSSKEAAYALIKNCSNEEFKQAIFFERIVFRVVNDDELVDTEQLRLELREVLSRNALSKFLDPLCMFLRLYHSLHHTAKSLLPFRDIELEIFSLFYAIYRRFILRAAICGLFQRKNVLAIQVLQTN